MVSRRTKRKKTARKNGFQVKHRYLASSPSSLISASHPSKAPSKPAKSSLVTFAQPKVAKLRAKKTLDVVLLVERNLELFKRGLKSRQNNQFELLKDFELLYFRKLLQ
jgi:hypothetical protein